MRDSKGPTKGPGDGQCRCMGQCNFDGQEMAELRATLEMEFGISIGDSLLEKIKCVGR